MNLQPYVELWLFAAFMTGTPGPANLLMMSAGASHGLRRCVGFLLGLLVSKALLNVAVGTGFAVLFDRYPFIVYAMKIGSAGVMIWLSVLTLGGRDSGANRPRMTFAKGSIVHLVNPKAYAMSILAWSNFAVDIPGQEMRFAAVVLAFASTQLIAHAGWGFAGQLMRRALGEGETLQRVLVGLTIFVVIASLFI